MFFKNKTAAENNYVFVQAGPMKTTNMFNLNE